ncbi:sensor histidine kinase [Nocardia macrotermitis]|uniref:sensor histidine kinase n=1 Tax=Nocardia macrotermitis TaxID=2585198 RepID=UPI001D11B5FD|nr:ATP-binding protein [Nocardia macrotermitis]
MAVSVNPQNGQAAGSGNRDLRAAGSAFGACAVVTAVAVMGAVFFSPSGARASVAIGCGAAALLVCAIAAAGVYYAAQARRYRALAEEAEHTLQTVHREAAARVSAVREELSAQLVAVGEDAALRIEAAERAVVDRAAEARQNERRRASAMAAFAGAAGRMQAMTTSMLAELREMEHRHGEPKVLADLLQLDHRTAQAGRLADSVAVLSGARTGRRWAKPIAMESILRGSMGRIAGYQRVRLRVIAEIGVAGHAAEGVMHALAELLDNACNFSPPTTEVHVYAAEVPAGVVVTIEDSGLVMSESALRRAEEAVSGAGQGERSDLSSLTGTRLGLAVVGHLARKHSLRVSYRPSAIGGTAVVVVVPRDLIVRVDRGAPAALSIASTRTEFQQLPAARFDTAVHAIAAAESAELESATAATTSVLPKRRKGSTLAAVHPEGLDEPDGSPSAPAAPPLKPSALGAFQRAISGRDTAVTTTPSPTVEKES